MENGVSPSDGQGVFSPTLYPRRYGTPISFRLWRTCIGVFFLFMLYNVAHLPPSASQGGNRLPYLLCILLLVGCVVACIRSAIAPKIVKLTVSSLTVSQLFSKTMRIQRKDIAACKVVGSKWVHVVIEHRNPKVAPIRLVFLNYDDAFWEWFSGIPGERYPRVDNWWSRR
jgi:hypothetical protein